MLAQYRFCDINRVFIMSLQGDISHHYEDNTVVLETQSMYQLFMIVRTKGFNDKEICSRVYIYY